MAGIHGKAENTIRYAIGFLVCLSIRLIPWRLPNVEPIMATIMPFSKKFRWVSGFIFGFLSILIYDFITKKVGIWTWVTAMMYGLVGVFAYFYLSGKQNKIRHYVGYSIIATLVYDAITGPLMSTFVWHMPFMQALIGQIPFTLWHLAGNIVFSALLSPAIYSWVIENKSLDTSRVYAKVKNSLSV